MFKNAKAFSGFSVDDLQKATDFYSQVLELETAPVNMPGAELLSLKIAGGVPILVYPKPNHEPATFTILNFPVSNIEEAVDELTRRGVRFEKYKGAGIETDEKGIAHGGGQKIAWFKDPAGNILSVIEQG